MLLGVKEVARMLSAMESDVYRWAEEDGLPAWKSGTQCRFNRSEVMEWAAARGISIRDGDTNLPPETSLGEALQAGGVHGGIPGEDQAAAVRSLIHRIPGLAAVQKETLSGVLGSHREFGFVEIGDGMAIPHVRHPIVLSENEAILAIGYLNVPLAVPDSHPVNTLFLLVTPNVRLHLKMVARLATLLRDPGFKAAIRTRAGEKAILQECRRLETPAAGGP